MDLDLKQMVAMVDIIAEEKNLPKETVIDVIQQAIAAAWRKDNGDKDMDVRCELNLNTGEADVFISCVCKAPTGANIFAPPLTPHLLPHEKNDLG